MELIEAKALANIRPELGKDGKPAEIVRKGEMAFLQVHELEHYVNIGKVKAPPYKYEAPRKKPGPKPKKVEGDDA